MFVKLEERLLEFALANDWVVGNTCFVKRKSHLITYRSGNHRTEIDYILYRKRFRKAVTNVKVIPMEQCLQQHNLVLCDFKVRIPTKKKHKFTPHIHTPSCGELELSVNLTIAPLQCFSCCKKSKCALNSHSTSIKGHKSAAKL